MSVLVTLIVQYSMRSWRMKHKTLVNERKRDFFFHKVATESIVSDVETCSPAVMRMLLVSAPHANRSTIHWTQTFVYIYLILFHVFTYDFFVDSIVRRQRMG